MSHVGYRKYPYRQPAAEFVVQIRVLHFADYYKIDFFASKLIDIFQNPFYPRIQIVCFIFIIRQ